MVQYRQKRKISLLEILSENTNLEGREMLKLSKFKRMNEKALISLKDAAKVSGYSADYIGQLIRAGKIPGKQVCCTVAWMTTANAVMAYKDKGKADAKLSFKEKMANRGRMLIMELGIIKLFFKTFKYSLPLLLVIIVSFSLLSFYIIYIILNKNIDTNKNLQNLNNIEQNLSF